jgi:hypothetical protein
MFADNKGSMGVINHPIASSRTKHTDLINQFVRERVARGEIAFNYCILHRSPPESHPLPRHELPGT